MRHRVVVRHAAVLLALSIALGTARAQSDAREGRAREPRVQRGDEHDAEERAEAEERDIDAARKRYFRTLSGADRGGKGVDPQHDARASRMNASRALTILEAPGESAGRWVSLGPQAIFQVGDINAGRIDGIALDPANSDRWIAASPRSGLWLSEDAGATWRAVGDPSCHGGFTTVTFDPSTPGVVYAGSSEGNGNIPCPMAKSRDGGRTWITLPFDDIKVNRIVVRRDSPNMLLASVAGYGIYRSATGGASWTRTLPNDDYLSVVADPTRFNVAFASKAVYGAASELWHSSDFGATWNRVAIPAPMFDDAGALVLAMSPAAPHQLWIAAASMKTSGIHGVFRYDDSTHVITRIEGFEEVRPYLGNQSAFGYALVMGVDPIDARHVYAGGVTIGRSSDGGQSFSQVRGHNLHVDFHDVAFDARDPHRVIVANDGGVFISYDDGLNWSNRNLGLGSQWFYAGISVSPTQPSVMSGGTQDNGTQRSNGSPIWTAVDGGDGGYSAISPTDPNVIWTTTQWPSQITKSTWNGTQWVRASRRGGIDFNEYAMMLPPLVMHPVNPRKLYFGTSRLYRTVDDGTTWVPGPAGDNPISSIAVPPTDTMRVYTGSDAISRSDDAGATFSSTVPLPGFSFATHVAVDPTDADRVLVTVGFSSLASHVYLSTDGARTLKDITGNLPDTFLFSAAIVPGTPRRIFVGSYFGVFESSDDGRTWTAGPAGMPSILVMDLLYMPTLKTLYAATHGYGMFAYAVQTPAAVLRGDTNGDGRVDAFDALVVQQAAAGTPLAVGLTPMPNGDANCDGTLDVADALVILRSAVGLATPGACVGTVR